MGFHNGRLSMPADSNFSRQVEFVMPLVGLIKKADSHLFPDEEGKSIVEVTMLSAKVEFIWSNALL